MQFSGQAQTSFFEPIDTFSRKRFNIALGTSAAFYTGMSIGLYQAWYAQFPQSNFHLFNDWNEWNNVDKMGHIYSAYFQSNLAYRVSRWTGLAEGKSILTAAIVGGLSQTTIEVMDGFSTKWGFSLSDFAANLIGIGAFTAQQQYWGEQRISFKVSSSFKSYDNFSILSNDGSAETQLDTRLDDLFGSSISERFLKDYNAQTIWVSANVRSFFPEKRIPRWFNIALGYSAENMYGGYDNSWTDDAGQRFSLDNSFDRYHQFILAPDIDLTRIKTQSTFWNSVLHIFNLFKLPTPAIEYNTRGEWRFHLLFS